jgi:hypothetical protein
MLGEMNKPGYDVRLTRLAAASFWVKAAEKRQKDSFFPNRIELPRCIAINSRQCFEPKEVIHGIGT